ncbi:MAG TPA: prenyltransferase/squalene oxidase repeat-containing protein [Planctomycetota bacterium]
MAAGLVLALLLAAQEPAPSLGLEVNRTIARAVAYLKGRQAADGSFPGHEAEHPGGMTAFAAYALAKSGLKRKDEALVRARAALAGIEMKSTYSASVQLLLSEALGPEADRAAAQRSLDFLAANQSTGGVWSYPGRHECGSNTQFALLALRAAQRMGLTVPSETLERAAEGLWSFQERSGGFVYEVGRLPYAGMTAAALSGTAVLEELSAGSGRLRATLKKHAKDRAAAEAWLEARFDVTRNLYGTGAWTPFWHYAYLWALERWCGLTGRERVAGEDWYARGARWLVDTQAADGSWTSDDKPLENTCLALLFLRRATVSGGEELAELYERIDAAQRQKTPHDLRPPRAAARLTEWLLAGPWQGKPDHRSLIEPPFEPARVEPKEGARLAKREWRRVTLKSDAWTNLDELLTNDGDHRLWALALWLEAAEACEAQLWLELEDGWDVYLDGARVSHERRVGSAINGDVRVPLALTAGPHLLLVLASDDGGSAVFGARLSGPDDSAPPDGLRAALVPKAKR